jgi:hypothetical protein
MRSADFRTLLDRCPAEVALFSTYAFQPTYFERSLLNSRALASATRVVVLMDGNQYRQLQRDGEPTRHLNHRYLLVPIFRKTGVFHPKLHLLASAKAAMVFCGSCNLTQPGCTHNLEMLNAIQVQLQDGERPPPTVALAQKALAFFETALAAGERRSAALAREWVDDLKESLPWLQVARRQRKVDGDLRLHHNLDEPLWDTIQSRVGDEQVERVTALSPFYDRELAVIKTMQHAWPDCQFRIAAQQHTSNLPTDVLAEIAPRPALFALSGHQERRLHAKMLTVETSTRTVVVAGSANFTRQAWEGINVEACLVWDVDGTVEDLLFDDELKLVSMAPEDFVPGDQDQPLPDPHAAGGRLRLSEAVLESGGKVKIDYGMDDDLLGSDVTLRLYPSGRNDPLPPLSVPTKKRGQATVTVADSSEMRHAVACELCAMVDGARVMSHRTWLVQQDALTHVPGEGDQRTKTEREVIESGRGLAHLLAEIEEEDGLEGLVRWLREHTIHFSDQPRQFFGRHRGIPRKRDPFRSDDPQHEAPGQPSEADQQMVQRAVQDFAERHRNQRLERHVRKGNIYGLRNYMDIFVAINSRVFEYYVRGLVKAPMAVGLIVENINTTLRVKRWRGRDGDDHEDIGYLPTLTRNYESDVDLLRERLLEANVPGHLCVSLLMAQVARVTIERNGNPRPPDMLERQSHDVESALRVLHMPLPTGEERRRALREYEFSLTSTEERLLVEIQVLAEGVPDRE